MHTDRNETMGRIVARAWSDPLFKARLLASPVAAIAELGFSVPAGKSIIAVENTQELTHIVLTSPRYTEAKSAYADIKAYGESYSEPRLFPLRWGSHDPVFTARFKADPKAALRYMDVHVPDQMAINVVENSHTQAYLVLPLQPQGAERSERVLDEIVEGKIPAAMRYAGLLAAGTYAQLFYKPG